MTDQFTYPSPEAEKVVEIRPARRRPEASVSVASMISANAWTYRDPRSIPPRQWLYGRHYVRGYATTTVAPGGLGKSSLSLVEAIAMVTGRPLLGAVVPKRLTVWYINLEDPLEEIERRIAAILLHFRIPPSEIEGRLYVNSGREVSVIVATKLGDRVVVAQPVVDAVVAEIRARSIDVLMVDPFVSCHAVPENDNGAIDLVTKTFARIAEAGFCCVELVHHVRKQQGGTQADYTVEDARGGGALIGAVRSARILNRMSKEDADACGIEGEHRRLYFRVDDGKANMQPPSVEKATWRKFVSVGLGNATAEAAEDWVGVVTHWTMPGAFDGIGTDDIRRVQDAIAAGEWAENIQASNWAGHAIAEALDIDATDSAGKQRVKTLLKAWTKSKALRVERRRSSRDGRDKPVIVVGERV